MSDLHPDPFCRNQPDARLDAGDRALADMLAAAAVLPDADLPGVARRVAAAMAAQFSRQEERFARLGCPCLADHHAIHDVLLEAVRAVAVAADDLPPPVLRRALAHRLAGLLDVHFTGADRQAVRCVHRPA